MAILDVVFHEAIERPFLLGKHSSVASFTNHPISVLEKDTNAASTTKFDFNTIWHRGSQVQWIRSSNRRSYTSAHVTELLLHTIRAMQDHLLEHKKEHARCEQVECGKTSMLHVQRVLSEGFLISLRALFHQGSGVRGQ